MSFGPVVEPVSAGSTVGIRKMDSRHSVKSLAIDHPPGVGMAEDTYPTSVEYRNAET
jgi:hypothetical protein